MEEWKPADKTGSYTVTDLDQNGSLEILSADYDDETKETVTKIWEVSPEGQLVPCELPWEEGDSQPDLITASAQVYYDEAEDTLLLYVPGCQCRQRNSGDGSSFPEGWSCNGGKAGRGNGSGPV